MFKKDKFCKFVILSLLIFVTPITFSNDNKTLEIERLKQEIVKQQQYLKDNFWKWSNDVNLATKQNKSISNLDKIVDFEESEELKNYADELHKLTEMNFELAKLEWRVYDFREENINWIIPLSWDKWWFINELKPWDIITIKYKPWFSDNGKFWEVYRYMLKYWSHSVLYIWNWRIIWAEGPNEKSKIMDARSYFRNKSYSINVLAVTRKNISNDIRKELVNFAYRNLLNVPYPSINILPYTKYSMNTYYCSSLAWRAFYNFWIDLDPNSWSSVDIIFPEEFLTTYDNLYYINF